jgi:hypothetical protein
MIDGTAPLIGRHRDTTNPPALTRPLPFIMDRILPRDGKAGVRSVPWRAMVA